MKIVAEEDWKETPKWISVNSIVYSNLTTIHQTLSRNQEQQRKNKETISNQYEWALQFYILLYYTHVPISDNIDRQVKRIFRESNNNVRLVRKGHTTRQYLNKTKKGPVCFSNNCPKENKKLCFRKKYFIANSMQWFFKTSSSAAQSDTYTQG